MLNCVECFTLPLSLKRHDWPLRDNGKIKHSCEGSCRVQRDAFVDAFKKTERFHLVTNYLLPFSFFLAIYGVPI